MKLRIASRVVMCALLALASSACLGPPDDPAAIARVYLEGERYAEAGREIDLALRQQPDSLELRLLAAEIHAKAGHHERAIGHLERAHDLSPRNPEVAIRLGVLEQARGNTAEAYTSFRRASNLDPEDIRAVSGLALSAEALGFEEEAQQAYAEWARLEGSPLVTPEP